MSSAHGIAGVFGADWGAGTSTVRRSPALCWGGRALADGLGFWDWSGVVLLLAIGVLTVLLLWPY